MLPIEPNFHTCYSRLAPSVLFVRQGPRGYVGAGWLDAVLPRSPDPLVLFRAEPARTSSTVQGQDISPSQDPPPFLFRGESVAAVEDDRPLAGDVADGAAHPVNENTLHDRNAGKVDDRLHVHGRLLVGEREEAPCPVTSQVVVCVSTA